PAARAKSTTREGAARPGRDEVTAPCWVVTAALSSPLPVFTHEPPRPASTRGRAIRCVRIAQWVFVVMPAPLHPHYARPATRSATGSPPFGYSDNESCRV